MEYGSTIIVFKLKKKNNRGLRRTSRGGEGRRRK